MKDRRHPIPMVTWDLIGDRNRLDLFLQLLIAKKHVIKARHVLRLRLKNLREMQLHGSFLHMASHGFETTVPVCRAAHLAELHSFGSRKSEVGSRVPQEPYLHGCGI